MFTVVEEPETGQRNLGNGDLDYYARPENYQGAKDSMRRFLTTHRPGRDRPPAVSEPDRKVLPREAVPSPKTHPVTGVWALNRGTLDRVMPTNRPAATYVRRITVAAVDDGGQTKGEFAGGVRRDPRYSIAVTGLRDDNDAPDSSRSSVAGEGSAKGGQLLPSREMARATARDRIRRAIRIVLISLRWMTLIAKQQSEAEQDDPSADQKTFTDIVSEVTNRRDVLSFDLSHFKSKKEVAITRDVRQILTSHFALRTQQQIQTAVYGLRHLESFAEYPQHMREKLCQVGWFQQVSPKRVIIRQGQPPENFYFILSGKAVVRFNEQNPVTGENQMRTAAMLRRGNSFGELALLHHTRRTATVVSEDVVQLLVIGKEDFFQIIMGLSPDGSIPDHIQFLSTLDFMKNWPIDVLANNPDQCMILYFKRGTVMVRDSTKSEWIYVVKSGSCQVIKKLVSVAPRTVQQRKLQDDQRKFPPELNASIAFSNIVKPPRRRTSQVESEITDDDLIQSHIIIDCNQQTPGGAEKRSRRWSFAGVPSNAVPPSEEEPIFVQVETLLPKDTFVLCSCKSCLKYALDSSMAPGMNSRYRCACCPGIKQGLRNINFEKDFEPPTGVEASVILVSKGAECVMLSKKCFTENANATVRHWVRTEIRPYPPDEVIEQNLQTHVDWMSYKKHLVQSFANARSARRRLNRVGHL